MRTVDQLTFTFVFCNQQAPGIPEVEPAGCAKCPAGSINPDRTARKNKWSTFVEKIKSKPGLLKFYKDCPETVRKYFGHLPRLVEEFPLDVALAYVFAQVEAAHIMALYCGVVKIHKCDKDVARQCIRSHHMTRAEFRKSFELIYGKAIPDGTLALATRAEAVRDQVMHGKPTSDDQKRNGIAHALQYAVELNVLAVKHGGPAPFGNLKGFKGAAKGLPKSTSRWVLRGMGFSS